MPLSRLENFLKNAEGNILYVNPSDFDATDSFENRGNSLTRPFKTIQRAIIESARFSFRAGRNNDKIDTTTILVYPGTHYIDNRPGYSIRDNGGTAEIKKLVDKKWTTIGASLTEFSEDSNFDIFDEDNDLFRYNSTEGGVILPRGTSIVGLDLRKTKIRPLYVPDPFDDQVLPTSIFRVTGTCYFTAFSIFDADPNRSAYKNSSDLKVNPSYSHHKLAVFEYADGVNDAILDNVDLGITDLDMYYAKVTYAFGSTSGRPLANYPVGKDFEPLVDEYRIVGDLRADPIGITSIKAGDGAIPTTTITVTTSEAHGLFKDTPILLSGITTNPTVYNGSIVVSDVVSNTEFTYTAKTNPSNPLPAASQISNAQVVVESDSVSSASPYIFSCTLRSVYGMNGMIADGNKATGFKSMLTAQFTGISLQKDDNAFMVFDDTTQIYNDNDTAPEEQKPLHINSTALYKRGWESTHVTAKNDSIIQCVSIFAIGFARHFVAETGGDMSITNSNSNFGAVALESTGFRNEAFDRDDVGYITHIIPPREPDPRESNITWLSLDAEKIVSAAKTERLYVFGYNSKDVPPSSQIDSYRLGAKRGEEINLEVIIGTEKSNFRSPVLMPVPSGIGTSSQKVYRVGRNAGINSISQSIFTLTDDHQLFNGEKVRLVSDTGEVPNNVEQDKLYFAFTTGLNADQIKLSSTLNDTINGTTIGGISNNGGELRIVSFVADKDPGELGHPMQFDEDESQWYLQGSSSTFFNTIYDGIVGIGTSILGNQTGATFVTRRLDNRGLEDRLYKFRYVIPKEFSNARPPSDGFILQESNTVGFGSASYLTSALANTTQLRNPTIITDASYVGQEVTIRTEEPHHFVAGDTVKIKNVRSTNNLTSNDQIPFNGEYPIYTVPSTRTFTISGITTDPGTFLNETNQRTTQQQVDALPTVQRLKYKDSIFVYRSQEIKSLIPGTDGQDGIYLVTPICGSIKPIDEIGYGVSERRFNQDVRNLYPQQDRDNYNSDPEGTTSLAKLSPLGKVTTNSKQKSVTKEALNYFFENNQIGYAITGGVVSGAGNTTLTIFLDTEHTLNSIKELSIITDGAGYNNNTGLSTTLYSTELSNNLIVGSNAAVRAEVSAANTVSSVSIVSAGGAYAIGNTMTVSASPAGAPSVSAVVEVTAINDNIGDAIELTGFPDDAFNDIFEIREIPSTSSIVLEKRGSVGLGVTFPERNDVRKPLAYVSSPRVGIATVDFTDAVGIATVTTLTAHGLQPGNTFTFSGFTAGGGITTNTFFERKFIANEVPGITTFIFNAGITTENPERDFGTAGVLKFNFSSNGRALGLGEENLNGRGSTFYAGITTTLSTIVTTTDTTITPADTAGFYKGDYVQIGAEIMRISNNASSGTFAVLRGQFSTTAAVHQADELIKKVRVLPMEIRRHSILRASAHTFEYLGFGPGNYSTGLPLKQDRILTDEEVLVSQAREQDGGTVVYTAMNDRGEFFTGVTKISAATGEEEVIEAPIVTYFGDDIESELTRRNNGVFDDLVVKNRITVEGGENNNQTSQFYGPVNFSQKVTSSSEDGLETKDLYIKGLASQPKLITVGISTPIDAKRVGDISLLATPDKGGHLGHIYADGDWRRFGMISEEKNRDFLVIDQMGIGEKGGVFDFTDELEVNGNVKVKDLRVEGNVTFAGNQAIGNASFDKITVNQTATFGGINTNFSIKHDDPTDIAQFGNLEVTGYAATFASSGADQEWLTIQRRLHSTYTGVSTFDGTLKVGNIVSNTGILSVSNAEIDDLYATVGTIDTLYAQSGIITSLRVSSISGDPKAGAGLTIYANAGIITSITGVAATITKGDFTELFATNASISNRFFADDARVNTGLATNFKSTNATLTNAYVNVGVVTTLVVPSIGYVGSTVDGWMGAPTAYINSGIVTTIQGTNSTYVNVVGSTKVTSPIFQGQDTNNPSGTGKLFIQNAQISSRLWLNGTADSEGIRSVVGVITYLGPNAKTDLGAISAGNMHVNCGADGKIKARTIQSTVPTGTAPLVVASTTKVTNLNADLLDGLNTSATDQSGASIVSRSGGSSKFNKVTCKNFLLEADGTGSLDVRKAATFTGNVTIGSDSNNVTLRHHGPLLVDDDATTSDARLKENIETIPDALDMVLELRGVQFDWKSSGRSDIGLIAQEVEEVLPECVTEVDDVKGVKYGNIVGLLIESIKELRGEITDLQEQIKELKGE